MPQAVAGAVVTALGVTGTTAAVIGAIAYAATVYAMNKAAQALARQPGKSGPGSGLEISVIDAAADARIIYGTIRTGGVNVIPALASSDPARASSREGDALHQILAFAAHEITSYGDIYLDDYVITQAELTAVTGTINDGNVNGTGKYKNAAYLRGYLGTTTQNVDKILNTVFGSSMTSTFRGRGIAYMAATYIWGKGKVYEGGLPNLSVVISGKKCYDPRLDVTPGASPTNPAYIAHTSNPALIWADYKMSSTYGQKVDSTDIDWDTVVAAADVCDALVAIPTATTQKRYTFNGVLSANDDTMDNEKLIVDSMMGKMSFEGKWRIFAGAWRAPAAPNATIEREDWVSISAIQTTAGRDSSRFNGAVCYFVDSARKWQRVECYRRSNDTYKSADAGERIWIEMDQPYTLTDYEAQRKAEFLLRQSRNGIKLTGTLPPKFMTLRTWDNVALNFEDLGWSGKTFTVSSCMPRPDGAVDVVLTEESSGDWTDLLEAEYNAPSTSPVTGSSTNPPGDPTSLVVSPQPGYLAFEIGEPDIVPLRTQYQIIASAVSSDASVGTVAWQGDALKAIIPWTSDSPYYWFARATATSYFSGYQPNTNGTLGIAIIPPNLLPYPISDPYFRQASNIRSYWYFPNSTANGINSYSQFGGVSSFYGYINFKGRGPTSSYLSGAGGTDDYTMRATREILDVSTPWTGRGFFKAQPQQWLNFYFTFKRSTAVNSGAYIQTQFTAVKHPFFNVILTNSEQENRRVDSATLDTWTNYTTSFQITNSNWDGVTMFTAVAVNCGDVQIGRFEVTIK